MLSKSLLLKLRKGHKSIFFLINQVFVGIRPFSHARPVLKELMNVLLTHWEMQKDDLFQKLLDVYREDRAATKMIEFLIYDLKDLKIIYLNFYDKYLEQGGKSLERSFLKDFTQFSQKLIDRMQIEEEYLFPLIEKIYKLS